MLLVLPLTGKAQSVSFFNGSVFEALGSAEKQGKMLLLEFYADWNRKSCWMHEVLEDMGELEDSFVVVSADTNTDEGIALAQQYAVSQYPMIVIFDATGKALGKIDQSMTEEDLSDAIGQFKLQSDKSSMWTLQTIYRAASDPKLTNDEHERLMVIVDNYLKTHSRELLLDRSHWDLFQTKAITYYGSVTYDFLVKNCDDFFSAEAARDQICDIVYEAIMPSLIAGSDTEKDEIVDKIAKDTVILEKFPVVEKLCSLVEKKKNSEALSYVLLLDEVVGMMPLTCEYQLVMTLEFIPDITNPTDKIVRTKARKMVESLQQKSLSQTKISLIESLLDKF